MTNKIDITKIDELLLRKNSKLTFNYIFTNGQDKINISHWQIIDEHCVIKVNYQMLQKCLLTAQSLPKKHKELKNYKLQTIKVQNKKIFEAGNDKQN